MIRLAGLLVLVTPGLLLLGLALSAHFGPLEAPGSRFGAAQVLLLVISVLALGYAVLVHAKAVKDLETVGRPYATTLLFVTVPTAIAILLTVIVAEITAGLLPPPESPGLIFPPRSSAGFRTAEFEWTVETNSLGIRDREIDFSRQAEVRILAIGDSFTNGWGVRSDQAWPKVLERRLRQAGYDAEVFNLGGAGASPKDYALVAQRGIPQLRPDLVLVGMLQGDDLAQLLLQGGKTDRPRTQRLMEWCLPNLSRRLGQLGAARPLEILPDQMRGIWQRQVRTLVEEALTTRQKRRWDRLDAHVKQMYLRGDLNPVHLRGSLKHPDCLTLTLSPDDPQVRDAVDAMAGQLVAIRDAAAKVSAQVVVVSVPFGPYVSRRSQDNHRRLGYIVNDAMLEGDAPDEVIRSACEKAKLPFHSVTDRFRKACTRRTLYYEFDGHFNPEGQALFAEAVCEFLLQRGVAVPIRPG